MSIPLLEVQFDRNANRLNEAEEQAVLQAVTAPGVTHILALSHGWNNDMDEARTLYRTFLRHLETVAGAGAAGIRAIGVLWPSKRFADSELIPGGAASTDTNPAADVALRDRLEDMKHLFASAEADARLEEMQKLVNGLQSDPGKQRQFVSAIGDLVDRTSDAAQRTADEGQATISGQNGADLLKRLGMPIAPRTVVVGAGGAAAAPGGGLGGNLALAAPAAGAAGIGDFFTGIKAGAMRLLNLVTYQTMKDRAGVIGRKGVNPLLKRIQDRVPGIPLHLAGHSFGGRLMTAAVDGPETLRVQSLLLLQAAYSHNGLSSDFDSGAKGFFHSVLKAPRKVAGPILITHSKHDRAVGLAYPLASRLNGDVASAIGDRNDKFGGMGANGAQHIGNDVTEMKLLPKGGSYNLTTTAVFNLDADDTIMSHGDVARVETAYVQARAMGL